MPTPISPQEAVRLGVTPLHERMDNGEYRFRLRHEDGSSYIRTQAAESSGWQNSHLHRVTLELNVIQEGTMILVEDLGGAPVITVLGPGDSFLSKPGVPHNSYLLPGTVAHTVKLSCPPEGDWVPCPALDSICTALDIEEILNP